MVKIMHKKIFIIIMTIACIAAAMYSSTASLAYATEEQLDDGAVSGLQDGIFIQDSQGYSVSKDGKYYIDIQDMQPGVMYKKEIVLQSLINEDYTISMNAELVSSKGNLDLLSNTKCRLYLDNKLIYEGKITGEGKPDMTETPLEFGTLERGMSKKLTAEIIWGGKGLDKVKGNEYFAKVEFMWIFNAIKTPDSDSSDYAIPNTGVGGTLITVFAVILLINAVFVGVMTRRGFRKDGTDGCDKK